MTVSTPPRNRSIDQGWVESTIEDGEVFLEGGGKLYRLTWESGQPDRRRALAAGHYKVRGYRIRKTDPQGAAWHISVSSPGFSDLVVRPKQGAKIDIKPTISMKCQVHRKGLGLTVFTPVLGEEENGLSVYRQGKRLPLGYRLSDASGATIATGTMRYG
ncbi:MAG: hypothetical protein ACC628_13050 [Pirellulaceae bacterium]